MLEKIRRNFQIAILRMKNLFSKRNAFSIDNSTLALIPGFTVASGIAMSLGLPAPASISLAICMSLMSFFKKIGPNHIPQVINITDVEVEREFSQMMRRF